MQSSNGQVIEKWKTDLILEIARRKGFQRDALEDAYQQLLLVVLEFKYDSAHGSGAAERTALISLIENQLNMILRSEGRRQKHVKKIQRVCGPSQYQPFTNDEHIEHERRFELGIDVRSALSHLTAQEQAVCAALADEMPRCGIAKKLNISRYEVERIIEGLAEKFSEKNLDAWVRE